MSDKESKSNLPEGRRVKKTSSSSRDKLYLKRQQLLEEMQSTEDERAIPVLEQIKKLKSASEERQSDEEDWGRKERRKSGAPWMLWVILGLAIPILLVGLLLVSRNGNTQGGGADAGTGLDFDSLSGGKKVEPEDWFVENSGEAFSRGLEILETLSKENLTLGDIEPLVRSSEQADKLMEMVNLGVWSGFDTREPSEMRWQFGSSGESGFMTMQGVGKDFRNFRAYFVRNGTEIQLDVGATEVFSDVPISELPGKTLVGSALIRCWIAKEPHFDARSDEKLFSWYQILGPDQVDFVWAYCRKGDPLDELLRKELNYGRLIGDRKSYIRSTIMLSNAKGFRSDEFLLDEVVADEWVLSNAE